MSRMETLKTLHGVFACLLKQRLGLTKQVLCNLVRGRRRRGCHCEAMGLRQRLAEPFVFIWKLLNQGKSISGCAEIKSTRNYPVTADTIHPLHRDKQNLYSYSFVSYSYVEAVVTFSDPHNYSGVSQRQRIPPNRRLQSSQKCDTAA